MSDEAHRWFTSWLPLAVQAGPVLTLAMAVILTISIWWMNGWLTVCIDRNREMAAQLGISPRTVESHRENLMKKLGVRTVAGLTRLALEAGLVRD